MFRKGTKFRLLSQHNCKLTIARTIVGWAFTTKAALQNTFHNIAVKYGDNGKWHFACHTHLRSKEFAHFKCRTQTMTQRWNAARFFCWRKRYNISCHEKETAQNAWNIITFSFWTSKFTLKNILLKSSNKLSWKLDKDGMIFFLKYFYVWGGKTHGISISSVITLVSLYGYIEQAYFFCYEAITRIV